MVCCSRRKSQRALLRRFVRNFTKTELTSSLSIRHNPARMSRNASRSFLFILKVTAYLEMSTTVALAMHGCLPTLHCRSAFQPTASKLTNSLSSCKNAGLGVQFTSGLHYDSEPKDAAIKNILPLRLFKTGTLQFSSCRHSASKHRSFQRKAKVFQSLAFNAQNYQVSIAEAKLLQIFGLAAFTRLEGVGPVSLGLRAPSRLTAAFRVRQLGDTTPALFSIFPCRQDEE